MQNLKMIEQEAVVGFIRSCMIASDTMIEALISLSQIINDDQLRAIVGEELTRRKEFEIYVLAEITRRYE